MLALGFLPAQATAQTTFYRAYGVDSISDQANCVLQMDDGGYLLVGLEVVDDSISTLRSNGVLLRTDEFGEMLWRRTYMGPAGQMLDFRHAIISSDGSIAIAGTFIGEAPLYDENLFIGLLDQEGELLWSANVGDASDQWGHQVREVPGGGFAVGGWSDIPPNPQLDQAMYLARFNAVGDTLWTRTYSDTSTFGSNLGFCLEVTPDSGFVLAGLKQFSLDAPLVYRLDQFGDTLWTRHLDTLYSGDARDVICTDEGNILITGYGTVTGFSRPYLAMLAPDGALLWLQTYPEVFPGWALAMSETTFGYVLGGMTGWYDFMIMAVDFNGELLWTHTIEPEFQYGDGYDVIQTSDGGFALCGLHGTNTAHMVLIKTDQNGLITSLGSDEIPVPSHPLLLFPNPTRESVSASYTLAFAGRTSIRLLNMTGQLVGSLAPTSVRSSGVHQVQLELSGFPAGCYYVEVATERENWTTRLIKQ